MDLEDMLLFQRQSARLSELETWLAMLIVRHGRHTDSGWSYRLSDETAAQLRAEMPRGQMAVSVIYDFERAAHVLDVL